MKHSGDFISADFLHRTAQVMSMKKLCYGSVIKKNDSGVRK